jgi:oligoribonuclease (3'-5' exoribonuclease)
MNDWCKEHHAKSGLVQRVRDSTVSMREAEQQVCGGLQEEVCAGSFGSGEPCTGGALTRPLAADF